VFGVAEFDEADEDGAENNSDDESAE